MFHVELRRFPHVTRAFNLTGEQLETRIIKQWVAGAPFELNEQRWEPDRTRLVIYEGPELRTDEIGLGRGWANVTRAGEDVTASVLDAARGGAPAIHDFKEEVLSRCAHGRVSVAAVVGLAGERHPQARVSERVALAERAIWELLHEHRVTMLQAGSHLESERWGPVLLSWETWTDAGVVLEAAGEPPF